MDDVLTVYRHDIWTINGRYIHDIEDAFGVAPPPPGKYRFAEGPVVLGDYFLSLSLWRVCFFSLVLAFLVFCGHFGVESGRFSMPGGLWGGLGGARAAPERPRAVL